MKLLLEFARAQPWHSLVMMLCLLVAAGAEAIGIASAMPLISMLAGPQADASATAVGGHGIEAWMNGAMQSVGIEPTKTAWLLVLPAAFGLRACLVLLARREIGYTVARVVKDLRLRLIRAMLASNWSYYVEQRVGNFANAYSTEAMRASKAYLHATWVVMLGFQVLVYISIAFAISWKVTLFASAIGVIVLTVLGPLVISGRKAGRKQTKLFTLLLSTMTDVFQGVKPLKAMAREGRVGSLLEGGTRRMEKASRKQVFSREAIAALQEPIMVGMLCLAIFGMGLLGFNIAAMGVMLILVQRTLDCLNRAQRRYQRVAVQESAYWSLMDTIEGAERANEVTTGGASAALERSVELRDICVRYGDTVVFDGLSLEIPRGEITALTGPSGGGKTTIVDLVVGLLVPRSGDVLVDGVRLGEIDLASWRQQVGYVPQEMFLLHDTVAMNVALGDPNVTREEIEVALKASHAWDFVSALPAGLDTLVGERGSALSGGQRQRIAIARAILHQPRLVVLDEATAALDLESEAAVWAAIQELRGQSAVIAISHQPALLEVADRVYHVANGRATRLAAAPMAEDAGVAGANRAS
ncbi:MAG: ABC transporter ATP-binding protein [Myxococcota bacterium]